MSVWFAYRCHYDLPATRFVKRFEDATILEWFRNHCKPIADRDEANAYVKQLLGIEPYGLAWFLTQLAEEQVPPPRNNRELHDALHFWSVAGEWLCQPHAIQGLDDDDEQEMAFYIFDDVFAAKYPERVAWLLQEDWQVPGNLGPGPFKPAFKTKRLTPRGHWEGTTFLVFLVNHDASELTDMNVDSHRLDGVRLPQLARFLARAIRTIREGRPWCSELEYLAEELLEEHEESEPLERVFLQQLRANPHDDTPWDVYGDWLEENGRPRAELWLLQQALDRIGKRPIFRHPEEATPEQTPNLSRRRVEPHVAQLCLHDGTVFGRNWFDHWIIFDDLWASAHPDLANSLLRQLDRWDVLSGPRRPRGE